MMFMQVGMPLTTKVKIGSFIDQIVHIVYNRPIGCCLDIKINLSNIMVQFFLFHLSYDKNRRLISFEALLQLHICIHDMLYFAFHYLFHV